MLRIRINETNQKNALRIPTALGRIFFGDGPSRDRLVVTALAQSDEVQRSSQQIYEMAALQSKDEVQHRERFRLDELEGDLQLIERLEQGPLYATHP